MIERKEADDGAVVLFQHDDTGGINAAGGAAHSCVVSGHHLRLDAVEHGGRFIHGRGGLADEQVAVGDTAHGIQFADQDGLFFRIVCGISKKMLGDVLRHAHGFELLLVHAGKFRRRHVAHHVFHVGCGLGCPHHDTGRTRNRGERCGNRHASARRNPCDIVQRFLQGREGRIGIDTEFKGELALGTGLAERAFSEAVAARLIGSDGAAHIAKPATDACHHALGRFDRIGDEALGRFHRRPCGVLERIGIHIGLPQMLHAFDGAQLMEALHQQRGAFHGEDAELGGDLVRVDEAVVAHHVGHGE